MSPLGTLSGSERRALGSDFAQLLTQELSDAVPRELADQPDRGGHGMGGELSSGAVDELLGRCRRAGGEDDESGPDLAAVR